MPIKNKVFVDSSFLVALYNLSDTLHDKTSEVNTRLASSDPDLYVSNYILLEVLTVLSQKIGRSKSVDIGERIIHDGQIKVVHITEDLQELSWDIFRSTGNKNMSFVDCSILAVMQDRGLRYLLTFDKTDFTSLRRQFGFSFF